jgi:hypothetical protein
MRADSYTAREIPIRHIDPSDQPTALPPNLPYPQLQQQVVNGSLAPHLGGLASGGMKHSQSTQSMASIGGKKGFFSNLGRRGSGKKESTIAGMGNGYGYGNGGAAKKDVRGLPISGPTRSGTASLSDRSTSPGTVDRGLVAPRVQNSISAPIGPRGPRLGSFTSPPGAVVSMGMVPGGEIQGRGSLDQGLSRMGPPAPSRGSLDSSRTGKWSMPPARESPLRGQSVDNGIGYGGVMPSAPQSQAQAPRGAAREDEVKQMADILPHADKAVLRRYLGKYGDQMVAIG